VYHVSNKTIDIVILSMLYPPDFGGMSSRAYSIAKSLSQRYTVHVISSEPRYPSGKINHSQRSKECENNRISVTRLPIPPIPYKGFLNRLILFTWYSILAFFALIRLKNVKAVISAYPHPAIDFVSSLAKALRSFKLVVDLSDLWPEAVTLPNRFLNYLFQAIGYSINVALFKGSPDAASVYNERALMIFQRQYGFSKPAAVVYNSADIEKFNCRPHAENCRPALKSLLQRDIEDKFVILYSGTIGVYQNVGNIVYAAQKIRSMGKNEVVFVIVGEGEEKDKVVSLAKKLSLNNVVFLPKLRRDFLQNIIHEADLALVPIAYPNSIALYVGMPIKWAEYMACRIPVLVPANSFIGDLTTKYGSGFEVDFSDPGLVAKAIIDAMSDKARLRFMGRNARQLAVDMLSEEKAMSNLNNLIQTLIDGRNHYVLNSIKSSGIRRIRSCL